MRFERLERQHVEECTYGYILTFQEEQWSYERAHMRLSDFVAAPYLSATLLMIMIILWEQRFVMKSSAP